jgi:hypothetical protein
VRCIRFHKHLPIIRRINIHHLLLLQCLLRSLVTVFAPTNASKLLLHVHYVASALAFATLVPALSTVSLLSSGVTRIVRTRARSVSQCHHGFQSACQSCHLRPLSDRAGRIVIRLFVSVRTESVSESLLRVPSPNILSFEWVALPDTSTTALQFQTTNNTHPQHL